ncbi:MAG: polysaccharide deacetylase family protein [Bacteroidales bacterium]|nr:polysaccharide deacetylase family protein [Bacteroidales bacterium]
MRKINLTLLIAILIFSGCSRKEEVLLPDNPRILVLMYHKIAQEEAENLYERSKTEFENDLRYLLKNNIGVISFDDLENIKSSGKMPITHSVIITFDDGDRSWYDIAVPLLRKYNMKATFFLWVEKMEQHSFLNWQEIRYISNITYPGGIKPFVFGSHTYSHPFLEAGKDNFETTGEYYQFLDWELSRSKEIIEENTPGEVSVLALPYGDGAGNREIIASAMQTGYKFIRTSRNAVIRNISELDLFDLPSLPMLDDTEQSEIGYYLNH